MVGSSPRDGGDSWRVKDWLVAVLDGGCPNYCCDGSNLRINPDLKSEMVDSRLGVATDDVAVREERISLLGEGCFMKG